MALMFSFRSISSRICSDQGSAPKMPALKLNSRKSTPISSATSAINKAYEGVQVRTVGPKSVMIITCLLVLPPEMGITDAPNSSAP